ncbi:unnamed protein product [Leuciscus chuanchicus]
MRAIRQAVSGYITIHAVANKSDECEEKTPHHSEGDRHDDDDDDAELSLAIYQSLQPTLPMEAPSEGSPVFQVEEPPIVIADDGDIVEERQSEPDLVSVLQRLENQLDAGRWTYVKFNKCNESALRAFSRLSFSTEKKLNVVFIDAENTGEGAVDDGGPTREFFRLLNVELKNSQYFCGPDESKNLTLVSRAVLAGEYRIIGKMLAVLPVDIDEIDDWELRQMLQKIKNAETLEGSTGCHN